MSHAITALASNLTEQVNLYTRLLTLSQAQLQALRAQDMHSVHALLQEIEMAMIERSRVEQRRSIAVDAVAAELGVERDAVNASLLEERSEPGVAQVIRTTSAQLRDLIAELDVVVVRNRELLEHELHFIEHMVRSATRAPRGGAGSAAYGKTGVQRELPQLAILDAQV